MSYFAADEQLLRPRPAERANGRAAPEARTGHGWGLGRVSGYFRADESNLEPASTLRAAPWGLRLLEAGQGGGLLLSWRKPYCRVDGFVVEGTRDGGEWHRLGEFPADGSEAQFTLAPGHWRLRVAALCNGSSVPGEALEWHSPDPVAARPRRESALQAPDQIHLLDQGFPIEGDLARGSARDGPPRAGGEGAVVRESSGGRVCPQPGCGAPLSLAASGNLCCEYCGAPAVLGEAGQAVGLETLLYGACSCCRPRRPLIRRGDELVCLGEPVAGRYPAPEFSSDWTHLRRSGEAQPLPELSWEAIDRALRENSAVLGRHGLFVRG